MTTNKDTIGSLIAKIDADKISELVKDFVDMYDNKVNKKQYINEILEFLDKDIEDISVSKLYRKALYNYTSPKSSNYYISHVIVLNKELCIEVYNDNFYDIKGIYIKDKETLTYSSISNENTWKILEAKYSELLYRLEDAIDAPISDIIKIG